MPHKNYLKVALRDRLLINKYVLHYVSVDFPYPIKEVMGECSAAYMRVNLCTSVKQHLKLSTDGLHQCLRAAFAYTETKQTKQPCKKLIKHCSRLHFLAQ